MYHAFSLSTFAKPSQGSWVVLLTRSPAQEFKSDVNALGKYVISDFATNQDFENYNWTNNYINSTFDVTINTNIESGVLLTKT